MQQNLGKTDRVFRFGLVIIVVGLVVGSVWGTLGLVPVLTGFAGWSPAYALIGVTSNTSKGTFQRTRSKPEVGGRL